MNLVIQPIVEGQGEVLASRDLITRVAATFWNPEIYVDVLAPILLPRTKIEIPSELEKKIELARRKIRASNSYGGILVLFDSDDDCPATLAPKILKRATNTCSDLPISVVMAHLEYEAWFLASASSIKTLNNASPHPNPESKRNAKGWLSEHMSVNYDPTQHQASFTTQFDLHAARAAAPSFDKLCRDLIDMLTELSTTPLSPLNPR
ncbi:MAG: hypothetical protein RLZZ156_1787 [Deinococcota bacterium]|jgi:hypothetical protein